MQGLNEKIRSERLNQKKRLQKKPLISLSSIEENSSFSLTIGKSLRDLHNLEDDFSSASRMHCLMFPTLRSSSGSISKELESIIGTDDVHQLRSILDAVSHSVSLSPSPRNTGHSGLCTLGNANEFWAKRSQSSDNEDVSGITTLGSGSFDLSSPLHHKMLKADSTNAYKLTRTSLCETTVSSLSAISCDTIDTYAMFCSPEVKSKAKTTSAVDTPRALKECEQALSLLDFDSSCDPLLLSSGDALSPQIEKDKPSGQEKLEKSTPSARDRDAIHQSSLLVKSKRRREPQSSHTPDFGPSMSDKVKSRLDGNEESEEEEERTQTSEYEAIDKKKLRRGRKRRCKRTIFLPAAGPSSGREVMSAAAGQRRMAPPHARSLFLDWIAAHRDNPYPSAEDKEALAEQTGLTVQQIIHWFSNMRKRRLAPLSSGRPAKANVDIRFQDELEKRQKSLKTGSGRK